jgi:hypothetical protein
LSQTTSLEQRVQVLEDTEVIRSLHHTYLRCIDKGWGGRDLDTEGLRAVLTDDIVFGFQSSAPENEAVARGVDSVVDLLGGMLSAFDFVLDGIQNINIDVDGDTARGTQVQWVAIRQNGQNDVMYESVSSGYVRTAAGWRISSLNHQVAGSLLASPVGS